MKRKDYITEFLVYLKIERNYSDNTIRAYKQDLIGFEDFLKSYGGSSILATIVGLSIVMSSKIYHRQLIS